MLLKKSGIGNLSELDSFSCPAKKYDLDLPMKSMQEFMVFDARLLQDDNFRDDMVSSSENLKPHKNESHDYVKKILFIPNHGLI